MTQDGIEAQRHTHLTRHKISCGEPEQLPTEQKALMADTRSVDDKLARRQLHRLVRWFASLPDGGLREAVHGAPAPMIPAISAVDEANRFVRHHNDDQYSPRSAVEARSI